MNSGQSSSSRSGQDLLAVVDGLLLPFLLQALIHHGIWPRNETEANRQNIVSLVALERIKSFAPEESTLFLNPPPFRTVAVRIAQGESEFWTSDLAAPAEIDPALAICIGDFGLGSDAPILLDYRSSRAAPRVLRLRWHTNTKMETQTHWVEVAPTFEKFVELLDLRNASPR